MLNGDISNRSIDIHVMIDGVGFLYTYVGSWLNTVRRKVALRFKSRPLMMATVKLSQPSMAATQSMFRSDSCVVHILVFNALEEFIVRDVILAVLGNQHSVLRIRDEDEFRDWAAVADVMLTNHYMDVNLPKRAAGFANADAALAQLSQDVKFGGTA